MKFAQILMLVVALLLTACGGFSDGGVSDLRTEPLPPDVAEDCPHPTAFLGASDWEIIAGRLGDALIICGIEKAIAVDAYDGLRATVAGD